MSRSDPPILIVEDDPKTASLVSLYLEKEGFRTVTAHDGRTAIDIAAKQDLRFVILDLMLPRMDGWDVCRALRRRSDVPILMLTAREDEVDRISGLTLGADDYVVKPFSPKELVARVKAILRRGRLKTYAAAAAFSTDGLTLDPETHQVARDGRPVGLTPNEYKLLHALMDARGRVMTRRRLLRSLYPDGETFVIDRVVDVHIGNLRQKIEKNPSKPRYVVTVRGAGYRFAGGGEA